MFGEAICVMMQAYAEGFEIMDVEAKVSEQIQDVIDLLLLAQTHAWSVKKTMRDKRYTFPLEYRYFDDEISIMFGGGVSSSLAGSSVAEKNLDRYTVLVGIIWFACIVGLGLWLKVAMATGAS